MDNFPLTANWKKSLTTCEGLAISVLGNNPDLTLHSHTINRARGMISGSIIFFAEIADIN
jgi:hypothetical protein